MSYKYFFILGMMLVSIIIFYDSLKENLLVYLLMYLVFFCFIIIGKKTYQYYFFMLISFLLVVFVKHPIIDSLIPILVYIILLFNFIILLFLLVKNKLKLFGWNSEQSILNFSIALGLTLFFCIFQKSDSEFVAKEIENQYERIEKECLEKKCPSKRTLSHGITSFLIIADKTEQCVTVYSYFSIYGMKKIQKCKFLSAP